MKSHGSNQVLTIHTGCINFMATYRIVVENFSHPQSCAAGVAKKHRCSLNSAVKICSLFTGEHVTAVVFPSTVLCHHYLNMEQLAIKEAIIIQPN